MSSSYNGICKSKLYNEKIFNKKYLFEHNITYYVHATRCNSTKKHVLTYPLCKI